MKLFHIHTWSKWSDPIDANHSYKKLQVRYCTECNKCHIKKIRQPWNEWFSASAILRKAQEK